MTAVESAYLAQLLDQRASEVRRLAVPSEALTDERRDIYRAIVTSALDTDVVSPERVIAELREMGRLERVGGDRGIHLLSEQTGMVPADGARAELLAAASARVIARTGMMLGSLAGAGQSREAADVMRSATSLLASFAGDKATPLKSMRDHISEWTRRATDPERRAPRIQLGALEDDVGDYAPGNMGLIYGFSHTGKSHLMQYMERRYAEQGYPTLRVSCEDPDHLNAGRLVSEVVNRDVTRPGMHDDAAMQGLIAATKHPKDHWDKRFVVEHTSSVESICATMRAAVHEKGVRVVFVDYAQMLRVQSTAAQDNPETRLSDAVAALKECGKELAVQLWLGSQVTVREPKKVNKPSPFDLKGSRAIYEKAESALALWVAGDGERYVEVQKNKSGHIGGTAKIVAGAGGVIKDLIHGEPVASNEATGPSRWRK